MRKIYAGVLSAMLLLSFAAAFVSADVEPNDSFANAENIYDGDEVVGTLDETSDAIDYYQINLNSLDTIDITLSGPGDSDYDLTLYDTWESYEDGSYGGASTESISSMVDSTGTYYIEIEALYGTGLYTLTVDVTPWGTGGGGTGGGYQGDYWVGGDEYVQGDPLAELPTWDVGKGWWFGDVADFDDLQTDIEQGLADLEAEAGVTANVNVAGGIGAYFGVEVVGDAADVGGDTCYNVEVSGGLGVDFGLEASVDDSIEIDLGQSIDINADASIQVVGDAILSGNIYFTVDELALAKIDLTLTVEVDAEAHLDATATMGGESYNIHGDAEASITGGQIDFLLTFNPPLDVFQFDFWEGKEWYVPHTDTTVSGSLTAQGTASYSIEADMSDTLALLLDVPAGELPFSDSNSTNLADEIGDNAFSETIPGGAPTWEWDTDIGTLFECVYASDHIFIIETSLGDVIALPSFPGTRDLDSMLPDMDDIIPSAGLAFDSQEGFITGATVDGEVMTEPSTKAEVEAFVADPQGDVTTQTGGAGTVGTGGGGMIMLILLVIIVIVAVIAIVAMAGRKKKGPEDTFGAPPQQEGYQQQQYQQPPPEQHRPPPPQEQPEQYQPPPPPQQGQ